MRKTVKLMLGVTTFAVATCLAIPASYAFGNAPWCAVIELGSGEVYWDCQYRTVEQCTPNVIAGNRGFCNPNPDPGPVADSGGPRPRGRRWHHPRDRD